ncbi:MAG: hypothetical protein ABSD43_02775, partial [Terracidiphilus sp.]
AGELGSYRNSKLVAIGMPGLLPLHPDSHLRPKTRLAYSQCPINDRLAVPGVSVIELLAPV